MKAGKIFLTTAGITAALCGIASAQTNYVTVTNYVTTTVVVTNVVIVTNVVPPAAPAPTVAAAAKMPPPPAPAVEHKYPWLFDAGLGLTLIRGTTEADLLYASLEGEKKTPINDYRFKLRGDYGNLDGKESVNGYLASGQWDHYFTDRFFGYIKADGLRDIIADVDYRAIVGPGVGYSLIKTTTTKLNLEAGTAFEAQQLDHKGDTYFDTIRGAETFEHKINDHFSIHQSVEILPQVDRWENYIVNFEIGVEAALTKSFSLKSTLIDNYNSQPPGQVLPTDPKILHNDAKIITSLSYKF